MEESKEFLEESSEILQRSSSSGMRFEFYEVIEECFDNNMKFGDFVFQKRLGRGAFGDVTKVFNTQTHIEYAIKSLEVTDNEEEIRREINFYKTLNSLPNVPRTLVKFFGYCKIKKNDRLEFHILMEYKKSNLALEIEERKNRRQIFSNEEILDFFDKMLEALTFLQKNGIAHRDLKPANIICDTVDGKLDYRLIDFGASKMTEDFTCNQTVIGTFNYMAPELRKATIEEEDEANLNFYKADAFSLGLILLLMINVEVNLNDFKGLGRLTNLVRDFLRELSANKDNDKKLQLYLPQLLEFEPSKRKDCKTIKGKLDFEKTLDQSIFNSRFFGFVILIYSILNALSILNH